MNKNLNKKIALIIAFLAVCIYGIIGVPSGFSGKALTDSLTKNIHLGLDLRGGAHLILQVVVSEAVVAETDDAVARIQQDLKAANLTYTQVYKPDPGKQPEVVKMEGPSPAASGTVRSTLDDKFSTDYDLSGGSDNSWTLTMKPNVETALEQKTVDQAIETITDRVNSLGVSEPGVWPYGLGKKEILVELPGISDLEQVKSIIQSTARLEIHPVVGGPYNDEQAALAANSGALPSDEMMLHGSGN